jgi:hypothetical protein
MTLPGYDAWKLATPYDDEATIGANEGGECGRYAEPDEDAPRGYKPKPCKGEMFDDGGVIRCDTCGELAQ